MRHEKMKRLFGLISKLNVFRYLRITVKLGLVVVVLLAGLAAIAGSTLYQQLVIAQVTAQRDQLEQFTAVNEETRVKVLESHLALDNFFLKQDTQYLKQFNTTINDANNATATLEKLAQNDRQEQVIYQLRDAISAYQRAAHAAATSYQTLGLNEDDGLRGEMRVAIHAVEDSTVKAYPDHPNFDLQYQYLRRHERGFLLREEDKYIERMAQQVADFKDIIERSNIPNPAKEDAKAKLAAYHAAFNALAEAIKQHTRQVDKVAKQQALVEPLVESLNKVTGQTAATIRKQGKVQIRQIQGISTGVLIVIVVCVLLSASLILLALSIIRSLSRLRSTVQQVTEGNLNARAQMVTGDELGQLGNAFDQMLDAYVTMLARAEKENEQLNDSVVQLMEVTTRLSERDLTTRAPITEDVTGNIGDALNQMAEEISNVMSDINGLATQLVKAASVVRQQGEKVADVAATERQVVDQALAKLEQSANTMGEMAELAQNSDQIADNAGQSTRHALLAVRNTVQSINDIRNSVGETEKGIKRLGERSQEIGSIVEIIRDIAERTHTLAINAGMQAVAAGEAGKGFSMVADEVQRLAETARESTDQIASLVKSIQAEASETMATMNQTIDQVVRGSELAEKAGKRMRLTRRNTEALVAAVAQITERSKAQATITDELRGQAANLQQSTAATEQELRKQIGQTKTMFQYLKKLVQSVQVFKLRKGSEATQAELSGLQKEAA
jgi:twitching motility protein PilJ